MRSGCEHDDSGEDEQECFVDEVMDIDQDCVCCVLADLECEVEEEEDEERDP